MLKLFKNKSDFAMRRYVACVPSQFSGFNDVMCQIWRAYEYAQSCDRVLLIDTRMSCLADDLTHYMTYVGPAGAVISPISSELIETLNTLKCYPKKFQYRLDQLLQPAVVDLLKVTYRHDQFEQPSHFRNKLKSFWHTSIPYRGVHRIRSYLQHHLICRRAEPLVIHNAFGGGVVSVFTMQLFRLNASVQTSIEQQLALLGNDYDAVHIRHTDYQTDYEPFLQNLKIQLRGRCVLICSDNPQVKIRAREILNNSKVLSIPQSYETIEPVQFGLPIHYQWHLALAERRQRNIGLLTDLIGLAKSKSLYFTNVGKGKKLGYSGFSRLARGLHSRPDILRSWAGI